MGLYNGLKSKLISSLRREVMDVTVGSTGLTPSQIAAVADVAKNIVAGAETPSPRSVSGATDVYLKQIKRDFENFSKSDAEIAIKSAIEASLENVTNIVFNRISIAGYEKSEEYATIKYQVSCGYDTTERRIETRYKLDYSLRFVEDGSNAVAYVCPNCNATLGSSVNSECPYCNAHIVMDTLYSWYVASLVED